MYLSKGNLPCQMAHTMQIAKMSEAISRKINHFELVTSGSIFPPYQGMDQDFKEWYGINHPYTLVRLPVNNNLKPPYPQDYFNHRYFKLATFYAWLKSPSFIYSRTPKLIRNILNLGLPVLAEWHEPIDDNSPWTEFFRWPNLIGVITTSTLLAENYTQMGLKAEQTLVVKNGIDLDNFLPHQDKLESRQKLNLPTEKTIVAYSGHLYKTKGIDTILEVAKLLPNILFLIVGGWQEDVERVREQCQTENIKNVDLTGHVVRDKLPCYLYAADILLLPTSKTWNQASVTNPLKLFDYMSVKRPIIASALTNIKSVLKDRENGFLVKADRPNEFKEAILALLKNPRLAHQLAQNAFNDVHNYTWDRRAEMVLEFAYQRLEKFEKLHLKPKQPSLRALKALRYILLS